MDRTPTAPRASAVERVRAALAAQGLPEVPVRQFAERTATAADAAAAIGTTVEQIVKSLIFLSKDEPLLVMVSGVNRVDVDKLTELVDGPVKRANADQVRELTGFSIGGVPPVGHARPIRALIDRDLLDFEEVWAAAGTPNSVFVIQPGELVRITGGQVADLKQ
jgi:prolyl-tRNA editing enzyme YbaK/EbsC (Cys-tRNA(Pro) deacylase)